jgi:hypothetical protein
MLEAAVIPSFLKAAMINAPVPENPEETDCEEPR